MTVFDFDLGVIGAGAAGLTMAAGAAQLGAKTLLIEKAPALGGDCLHYGCVPSKTLIKTAQVYHLMKNGANFGLPQPQVPPVEFASIARRIADVIATIQHHDSEERFCSLGAKVEFGPARFCDQHTVEVGEKIFSAEKWLIATGSSPAVPPIEGLAETSFITNLDIFSLDRLPESLIILGGGPIGIEMAQAFRRLGSNVTVIQKGDRILGKEDKDLSDQVLRVLKKEGVTFHLSANVKHVRNLGSGCEVLLETEQRKQVHVSGDRLLVAAGRVPNVADLNLEAAGVEFSPRGGVPVDSRMRTNQKHIFSAGDATGKYLFTHAAGYEAGIALTNAILRVPRKADYSLLPWCTYTDPELASIGMNETAAGKAGLQFDVWTEEFRNNDRSLAEGEQTGVVKMIVDKNEKILGVQVLGPHAGDLICEWVAVLNGKVKLTTLAGAIHPYPTLAEINKRVAGDLLAPKLYSDLVKKGLKLFFNLKGRACGMPDGA